MKSLFGSCALVLAAGCSSPARYALDVTATQWDAGTIVVEGELLHRAKGRDVRTPLPKVLLDASTEVAQVYVGDGPAGTRNPDGIHGTVTTVGDQVLYNAMVVEAGKETWRGRARVAVATTGAADDRTASARSAPFAD